MHFAPSLLPQPRHFSLHSFLLLSLSSQTSTFSLLLSLSLMSPSQESAEGGMSHEKPKRSSSRAVLALAYQSLGVVYGDLSTSPLYVYKTTFSGKLSLHETDQEIYGVLSFIFWTFTVIALLKYVFIVMSADDNGEGGTFALYSLLCRHARLSVLPNQEPLDEKLSAYAAAGRADTWQSSLLRSAFEKRPKLRQGLFVFVLLGTSMAIGDGVFTPTISVLSSVSGLKVKITELHENYVVAISCIMLVGLFSLQHQGTHKVAFLFAPIVTAWLLCISGIGLYNILKWNPSIFHALSPFYMFKFLRSTGLEGWVSLGGIVLSITGVEAMFADLGHFSALSIKIAFAFVVYPLMILAYMGEAAFLSKHQEDIQRSFYKSIPEPVFWPVFIVATFASVVGSQAAISATFSIVSQCCALDCFPHVKTVHTSSKIYGQIYIPEVNWMLMFLCLAVTIGLRDTNMIGHAYGLAVSTVMFVTTCLMSLVMIIVWKKTIGNGVAFFLFFGSIELLYFSACVVKVPEGGWIPLAMSLVVTSLMYVWNYGTLKKHIFDLENKVSINSIVSLGPGLGIVRVPGIGLVYSNLISGVPTMFGHFVANLPAFHQVLIFVCVKSVQVPYICEEQRLLIRRVGPKEYCMFRCIMSYGYKDVKCENYNFESQLVSAIVQHIETEEDDLKSTDKLSEGWESSSFGYFEVSDRIFSNPNRRENDVEDREMIASSCDMEKEKTLFKDESLQILKAKECGVAFIFGHISVKAKKSSSALKKFVVDVVFGFLSENCRNPDVILNIPHTSLLEVGMIYHV